MRAIRVALAVGMAILLPMLAQMSVRIYADPPKYEDVYPYYDVQPKTAPERAKAESEHRKRQAVLDAREATFNLQVFYVSFPLGILELFAGFWLRRWGTLAAGIMFGGLSTIACGSYTSWETLPGWMRYVSLLFVLVVLGGLAVAIDRRPRDVPVAPMG